MPSDTMELFREGKFSFRILTPEHHDAALIVLARAFCTEPMCSRVAEINPEMKTNLHDWVEFIDSGVYKVHLFPTEPWGTD